MTNYKTYAWMMVFGLLLGFSLSRMGFSNYDELHKMFTFADWRLFLTFACGLVLATIGFQILLRRRLKVHRPLHKGSILGGMLFGAGWVLCGGCPSIPLVQLGEGRLPALATIAGIMAGTALFGYVQRRWLHWDTGSCAS